MIAVEFGMSEVAARLVCSGIALGIELGHTPGVAAIGYLAGNALAVMYPPAAGDVNRVLPEDSADGDPAAALVAELSPIERRETGRLLDEAFRIALREALYDIGGQACFRGFPPGRWFGVPMQAVFPLAGGRNLWHVRDPRTVEICRLLHSWVDVQNQATPDMPGNIQKIAETWLSMQRLDDIGRAFLYSVVDPTTCGGEEPLCDLPLFETHLRRWAFERTWARLGELLAAAAYHGAWQAFCRLLVSGAGAVVNDRQRIDFTDRYTEEDWCSLSFGLAQLIARSGVLRKASDECIWEVFGRAVMEG